MSTIIPVYNRPAALRDAVASVLAQDYRPIEVLIVDDGSTDETPEVAAGLALEHPLEVRLLRQRNEGPGLAREAGREKACGELVQYLDSDDALLAGKFRRQVAALRERPDCGVAYGQTRHRALDGGLDPMPWKGSGRRVDAMFPSFLCERWWDTPNPLYRSSVLVQAGPWTALRLEEDWEYDCRIAALGTRLAYVSEFVCEVRDHHEDRLSRGSAQDAARNRERARARTLIYEHAQKAGISRGAPEMRHFARSLFLLARQCGASGLAQESRALFELARRASEPPRARALDFRVYSALAGLIGWRWAGILGNVADRVRAQGSRNAQ